MILIIFFRIFQGINILKVFKMTKKTDVDFIDSLKPLYYISKIFGMAPYKIVIENNRKTYATSHLQIVLSLSILSGLIVVFKFGFDQRSNFVQDMSEVEAFLELLHSISSTIMSVGHFLMALIYREKFINMWDKLRDMDEVSVSLGIWINYAQMRWKIIFIIAGWICLSCVETILDWIFVFHNESLMYWSTYWVPYFISSITECSLMCSLVSLQYRYLLLNKSLKEMIKEPDLFVQHRIKIISKNTLKTNWMRNLMNNLNKCSYIHWHLTDCGMDIDQLFSFSILLLVTDSFVAIISSLFYMWVHMKKVNGTFSDIFIDILGICYYSISAVIRLFIIIKNYTSTSYQVTI